MKFPGADVTTVETGPAKMSPNPTLNRRFTLRERLRRRSDANTVDARNQPISDLADGEALIRVDWISLDPTNLAWLRDTPTYLPPVAIGDVMRGWGLGESVESRNPRYS